MSDADDKPASREAAQIFGARSFVNSFKQMFGLMGWALPTIFVIVKLNTAELINQSSPSIVMSLTMSAWFLSWGWGLNLDLKMQEQLYLTDPEEGQVPIKLQVNFWLLFLVAVVLLTFRR